MRILWELCVSFGHFAVTKEIPISVNIEGPTGHGNFSAFVGMKRECLPGFSLAFIGKLAKFGKF